MAPLLGRGRIAHHDVEHEAIELGFGQRIGAFLLDRILGGQHEQRQLQRMAHAGDGDLRFLHRLEQRRLGARRRAVDLVGEDHLREDRPGHEAHRPVAGGAVFLDHLGAEHVGGHQVGRELDAAEAQVERPRQRLHQQRLGQAGHALQQSVPAGQQREQHLLDDLVLADDHPPHGLIDALRPGRAPRRWTSAGSSAAVCSVVLTISETVSRPPCDPRSLFPGPCPIDR